MGEPMKSAPGASALIAILISACISAWVLTVSALAGFVLSERDRNFAALETAIKDFGAKVDAIPSLIRDSIGEIGSATRTEKTPANCCPSPPSFCPADCQPKPIGVICFECGSDEPAGIAEGTCRAADRGDDADGPRLCNGDGRSDSFDYLARRLRDHEDRLDGRGLVLIEGHANSIGSATRNLDLSERRAKAVRDGLRTELAELSDGDWEFRLVFKGESHDEPNPERDSPANRKASIALCLPVPAIPETESQEASK